MQGSGRVPGPCVQSRFALEMVPDCVAPRTRKGELGHMRLIVEIVAALLLVSLITASAVAAAGAF